MGHKMQGWPGPQSTTIFSNLLRCAFFYMSQAYGSLMSLTLTTNSYQDSLSSRHWASFWGHDDEYDAIPVLKEFAIC